MPLFSKPVDQPALSPQTVEFFNNAKNTVIHGSSFSIGNSTIVFSRKDGFQILQERVAPAAFHNSKQRVDPPRCHPHTREAVLDEIFDWIVRNVPRETWIAWINGAAGAGKTAICQSIAERCIQHGIMVASFFFFRIDSTRNTIDPLVVTLVYQIIQLLPQAKKAIVKAIESNPLIFEQTLEEQLHVLIIRPLRPLQISDPLWKLLVIIDGVDECTGERAQMNLIRTMAKLMRTRDLPFIVLFGSRRENHILMSFNPRDMNGILTQIPLDDNYHAEVDILHFLNDSFEEIKQTHPYGNSLGTDWPSQDHVQEIVTKSSGQFIYASVVINFLSAPSSNPSVRLDIIRGLRPSGRLTPFAQLDALYSHIFSQVDDGPTTLNVLAHVTFGCTDNLKKIMYFFELGVPDIQSIFSPLASVLLCNPDKNKISFRHASLPDFLQDRVRSGEYCINALATPLCIRWFRIAQSGCFRDLTSEEQNDDILDLLAHAEITDELYESLLLYTPLQNASVYQGISFATLFLTAIRNMNFNDGGKAYANMLNTIVRHVKKKFPKNLVFVKSEHNISQILAQLDSEDGKEFSSGSESNPGPANGRRDRVSTSSMEAASGIHKPASFTDVEEALQPPIIAQLDQARETGEVSTSVDCHGVTPVNMPSSPSDQTSSSRLQKRTRGPTTINRPEKRTKTWLGRQVLNTT